MKNQNATTNNIEVGKNELSVIRIFGNKDLLELLSDLIAERIKTNKLTGTDSNQSKQILHI